MKKPHTVFLCLTAVDELGKTDVTIHESAAACADREACTDQCGIAEARITVLRTIRGREIPLEAFVQTKATHARADAQEAAEIAAAGLLIATARTMLDTTPELRVSGTPDDVLLHILQRAYYRVLGDRTDTRRAAREAREAADGRARRDPMWCSPCRSFHVTPRDDEHHAALQCFGPKPSTTKNPRR